MKSMLTRRFARAALLAGAALSVGACGREAREEPDAFSWSDELAPGTTLHLRTTNGDVTVRGTAERHAHVQGIKRWRRGRGRDVRFLLSRDGDDVYACAIWVRRGGRCGDERIGPRPHRFLLIFSLFRRSTDMSASFEVMLPAGVRLDAATVNGRIVVTEAAADVQAETVNGDMRASTMEGALRLTTVNGSIRARVALLTGDGDIRLETVNGSVEAELPPSLDDASVHLRTTNGRISTDFPLAARETRSTRELRGTLGAGSRTIELTTVNGSVGLKRGGG